MQKKINYGKILESVVKTMMNIIVDYAPKCSGNDVCNEFCTHVYEVPSGEKYNVCDRHAAELTVAKSAVKLTEMKSAADVRKIVKMGTILSKLGVVTPLSQVVVAQKSKKDLN